MNARAGEIANAEEAEAESRPFLCPRTYLGAVKRGLRPGITAATIIEEGCLAAAQKYRKTWLAAAGAFAAEGLWTWQLQQERAEREGGPAR